MEILIPLGSALIGALATYLINTNRNRRTTDAMLFCEYAKRYDAVLTDLNEVFDNPKLPEDRATSHILRYLNLCSEELWLWQYGFIRASFWTIWESEMVENFRHPRIQGAWDAGLKSKFVNDRFFAWWVKNLDKTPTELKWNNRRHRAKWNAIVIMVMFISAGVCAQQRNYAIARLDTNIIISDMRMHQIVFQPGPREIILFENWRMQIDSIVNQNDSDVMLYASIENRAPKSRSLSAEVLYSPPKGDSVIYPFPYYTFHVFASAARKTFDLDKDDPMNFESLENKRIEFEWQLPSDLNKKAIRRSLNLGAYDRSYIGCIEFSMLLHR